MQLLITKKKKNFAIKINLMTQNFSHRYVHWTKESLKDKMAVGVNSGILVVIKSDKGVLLTDEMNAESYEELRVRN